MASNTTPEKMDEKVVETFRKLIGRLEDKLADAKVQYRQTPVKSRKNAIAALYKRIGGVQKMFRDYLESIGQEFRPDWKDCLKERRKNRVDERVAVEKARARARMEKARGDPRTRERRTLRELDGIGPKR